MRVREAPNHDWPHPSSSRRKNRRICIILRNDLWQKWGGHVHPSPPRGDAPEAYEYYTYCSYSLHYLHFKADDSLLMASWYNGAESKIIYSSSTQISATRKRAFRVQRKSVIRFDSIRLAEWYGGGLATARSWVRIPPTAAVYQRQLSVPSFRGRWMSTSESWESKRAYHAMHWPRIRGLVASAGVRLRAMKRRSAPPHGP